MDIITVTKTPAEILLQMKSDVVECFVRETMSGKDEDGEVNFLHTLF